MTKRDMELEELRAQRSQLYATLHTAVKQRDKAEAEIERLRAALQEIAREDHDEEAQPGPYSKIATAALEQERGR